jgi:hypothetical protein
MRLRGVRGVNRFDFFGRIRRRQIRPGVYILSLTLGSSHRPLGQPLLVQVVSPRRTILLGDARKRSAACEGSAALASRSRLAAFTPGLAFLPPQQARPTPAKAKPPAQTPTPERGGVAGVSVDIPALPSLDDPLVLVAALLLIGLTLIAIIVFGVRFYRERWY